MVENQTVFTSYSTEQFTNMMKMIVRSELASYVPASPTAVALPDYPSRRQTKEVLGVTYTTLTNWSKPAHGRAPILVPFKVGSRVRYRREEVLAVLKEYNRLNATQKQLGE